jgi:DNA-binding HxlR family transcriptional regulator
MARTDTDALLALARKRAAQPCGVETTLSVIEGRWKLLILFQLLDGTKRFGELKKRLTGVTQRMLTLHLRELERDGLIHREVYREVPPKVEYSLTEMGRSLEPLLHIMSEWGHGHRASLVAALRQAATTAGSGRAADAPSPSWPGLSGLSRPSVAAERHDRWRRDKPGHDGESDAQSELGA